MSAHHTQGAVRAVGTDVDAVVDGVTTTIADCLNHASIGRMDGEANARRIAACWNACDGVETELLEQHPAPFSALRAQHDALLKALTDLVANQDVSWRNCGFTDDQIKVMPYLKASRDAIAGAVK